MYRKNSTPYASDRVLFWFFSLLSFFSALSLSLSISPPVSLSLTSQFAYENSHGNIFNATMKNEWGVENSGSTSFCLIEFGVQMGGWMTSKVLSEGYFRVITQTDIFKLCFMFALYSYIVCCMWQQINECIILQYNVIILYICIPTNCTQYIL